ncbi:MAG TPA: HEAT repeat domain-containing protein [Vicinamibacteria bacterium]|nr:HEAT repeat domain-containing protein [Vicinamibacteria bacterium]
MAQARSTSALVEQFRRGGVARDLRLMAAQGLLPLKPEDLLELWTDLVRDPDEGVRGAAERSLASFPANELLPILKSRDTPPSVLSWAVTHRKEHELREATLQNTSLPDETIEALAPTLTQALCELVVINQQRLLRRTSLLVALESNAGLNNDQKRRLRELRESFHIGEVAAAPAPPPPLPSPTPEPPLEAAAEPVAVEETPVSEDEYSVKVLSEEERQQAEKVSTIQKIYRLNTVEKIQTANKGSREERTILIRDPNRLVSAAVLDSPRLTEPEIESFSAMKNVSDQVLRHIGNHREWTKNYAVINNLVRNPRTPIGIALNLVPRLSPRDIKGISVDRNVPEAVRKQAQKFVKGVPQR